MDRCWPPPDEAFYQNNIHSLPAIASNVVRNLAVHATGLPRGQSVAIWAVRGFHQLIRWNITDPRTTFLNTRFELTPYIHEDTAGNPLHLVLVSLAIVVCLWSWDGGSRRNLLRGMHLRRLFVILRRPEMAALDISPSIASVRCGNTDYRSTFRLTTLTEMGAPVIGSVLLLAGLLPASRNFLRPLAARSSIL